MSEMERLALEHGSVRRVAAIMLRDTITDFNAVPTTPLTVYTLVERVLQCADMLAIPVEPETVEIAGAMLRSVR